MQYLTFSQYAKLGGTLEETAFNRNIDRACGVIDSATQNRVERMAETPASVKALCRDLVEYFADNDLSVKSKSQSAGSVSESITLEDADSVIDKMICDYLLSITDDNGTPLLYRGCIR